MSRKMQEGRRDEARVPGLRPGCECADDTTGPFRFRQYIRDEWTPYVSDDQRQWLWDLVFADELPSDDDPNLPVILRMDGAEIEVDHGRVILAWISARGDTTDLVLLRLGAVEHARITEGSRADERFLEVRGRPLRPPAEFPRTGWVYSRMSVGRKHHKRLDLILQYMCDLAWQTHGRDIRTPPEEARPSISRPVADRGGPAGAGESPVVEIEAPAEPTAEHTEPPAAEGPAAPESTTAGATPAVVKAPSRVHPDIAPPSPAPHAHRTGASHAPDPGRILRVEAQLAPANSDWLSFELLTGTDSLLAREYSASVTTDQPEEVQVHGD